MERGVFLEMRNYVTSRFLNFKNSHSLRSHQTMEDAKICGSKNEKEKMEAGSVWRSL